MLPPYEVFHAIEAGRVVLYYQPLVDLQTRQIIGYECLSRMIGIDGGIIAPAQFLPQIEGNYCEWEMLKQHLPVVAQQLERYPDKVFAYNLSATALHFEGLPELIGQHCQRFGPRLWLEISENVSADVFRDCLKGQCGPDFFTLKLLAENHPLEIDDFGVGSGGFERLVSAPGMFSGVKIDRQFVQGCCESPTKAAVLRAIAEMCSSLSLTIVAEGIEKGAEQEAQFCRDIGIHYGQGWLFGKAEAVPVESLRG